MDYHEEIKQLRDALNEHGYRYYVLDAPVISDREYDLLNRQMYVKTLDGKEQENLYDGEGLQAGLKENGKASKGRNTEKIPKK